MYLAFITWKEVPVSCLRDCLTICQKIGIPLANKEAQFLWVSYPSFSLTLSKAQDGLQICNLCLAGKKSHPRIVQFLWFILVTIIKSLGCLWSLTMPDNHWHPSVERSVTESPQVNWSSGLGQVAGESSTVVNSHQVALLARLHVLTTVALYSGCREAGYQEKMGQIFLYYVLVMNPILVLFSGVYTTKQYM